MKITQVVRSIHPNGGISGVAFFLRNSWTKSGIKNDVIDLTTDTRRRKSRIADRLQYISEVLKFTLDGSIRARRLRSDDKNVTIVHGDALYGDVYVDHGLHKAVVLQKPSMFLRNPIHIFLYIREEIRHRFRTYKYIVSLSEYSEEMILKYYPYIDRKKIVRIPNGVDIERFSVARTEGKPNELRLIFIGHEYERKGLRFAIAALANLPKGVTLSVVGGSTEEIASHTKLAEDSGVSDRVHFLGRRTDIPELLAQHDVLVLPARYESWGLVVIEAMASGVPVLCTPVGCATEVIAEGETGYIIEQSADSIAAKVQLILDNEATLPKMREASRAVAQAYSWDKIANRYVDLVQRVLMERNRHEP